MQNAAGEFLKYYSERANVRADGETSSADDASKVRFRVLVHVGVKVPLILLSSGEGIVNRMLSSN